MVLATGVLNDLDTAMLWWVLAGALAFVLVVRAIDRTSSRGGRRASGSRRADNRALKKVTGTISIWALAAFVVVSTVLVLAAKLLDG